MIDILNMPSEGWVVYQDVSEAELSELINSNCVRPCHGGKCAIIQDVSDKAATAYASTSADFDWHTDGPYYDPVPQIVGLYCDHPGEHQIGTELADGKEVLGSLNQIDYCILSKAMMNYCSTDGKTYSQPLVRTDGTLHLSERGYISQYGRLEEMPNVRQMAWAFTDLMKELDQQAQKLPSYRQSDLLLFDNRKYVHRRPNKSKVMDPLRRLRRIWFR